MIIRRELQITYISNKRQPSKFNFCVSSPGLFLSFFQKLVDEDYVELDKDAFDLSCQLVKSDIKSNSSNQ